VRHRRPGHDLHVVGSDVVAAGDDRPRPDRLEDALDAPGRDADFGPLVRAGRSREVDDVAPHRSLDGDVLGAVL